MKLLKDGRFWAGVAVGTFVVPAVMTRVPALANIKARIPA